MLSLGLGLTLLVSLALIDTNLRDQLSGSITEKAPDFFFLDVQDQERDAFVQLLEKTVPGGTVETVPMLRGRIVAVAGTPAAELTGVAASSWALRGDRGITYSDTVPQNSTVVAGEWWPPGYDGEPLVSLEQEIADDLGLSIGDTIGVNVLGRTITARIANLRELDWEFALHQLRHGVFAEHAPRRAARASGNAAASARSRSRDAEREVLAAVTGAFPGVTSISVREAIESVNAIVADLALAVRVAASLALVVSMLVLGGALAAGHRQRRQDAVVLKTLGATRPVLLSAFSLEYGLLGIATALFALAAGSAAAWYVVKRDHGARIHDLSERRGDRRGDRARRHARTRAWPEPGGFSRSNPLSSSRISEELLH